MGQSYYPQIILHGLGKGSYGESPSTVYSVNSD